MSTTSTTGFISAHCDTTQCEIGWLNNDLHAFIPNKKDAVQWLALGTQSFTQADINARTAGWSRNGTDDADLPILQMRRRVSARSAQPGQAILQPWMQRPRQCRGNAWNRARPEAAPKALRER